MRLNSRSRMSASVLISNVLASPGTPVIRQWPPVNSAISTCSTTSSWPTMTLRSSVRIRSRPAATFSALTVATDESMRVSLMRESVDDFVDPHPIGQRGVFDVTGVVLGVGPLPPVAHVRVEIDEHHRPAGIVEDRAQVLRDATAFPRSTGKERTKTGDLRESVQLVKAAEHRVVLRHFNPVAIGKQQLHLLLEVGPFGRSVEIIHHREAASREVLAQNRHFVRLQAHAARLHEVDPRVLEQPLVVDGQE